MPRIGLAVVLAVSLALAPLAAEGQQSEKMARVGILGIGPIPSPSELAKSVSTNPFWLSMKQLGWIDGQNVLVARRYGESAAQLHASAAELVQLKVDVLVVPSCGLAKITQAETTTIPIVVQSCGFDMVAAGLATSLARPGGNITGSQVLGADLMGKRYQLLKELVPNLSRVALLREEGVTVSEISPTARKTYDKAANAAARTLGIEVDPFTVNRPEDFAVAFRGMRERGDRGLLVNSSPFTRAHGKQIVDLAATHRIAGIYEDRNFVEAGGLMSYGASQLALASRAAVYVDKILKGAKPHDLPIEQPTKFELVINLKTAKALGLTIPQSVLVRADELIQ
jgi:putative ABC transport system substrate-binding protein